MSRVLCVLVVAGGVYLLGLCLTDRRLVTSALASGRRLARSS